MGEEREREEIWVRRGRGRRYGCTSLPSGLGKLVPVGRANRRADGLFSIRVARG